MKNRIIAILHDKKLIRYFVMAVMIVTIELAAFQVLILAGADYLFATTLSFVLAVILNWIGGRIFVFGTSHHHPVKEFLMILTASTVGLVIQMLVVFISIEILLLYPLIGKGLSILFSFFWNYFFRAKIVYKNNLST